MIKTSPCDTVGRKVWLIMIPENDAVRKMLSLSDAELIETIKELCAKNGINTSSMNIGPKEMAILRTVLKNAKEEDIARMISIFGTKKGERS